MWYVLVVILGAIGALALVRFAERLAVAGGGGPAWIQLLIGIVFLFGAWQALRKARAK